METGNRSEEKQTRVKNMEIYSRIEKTREVIKKALKIEQMPPDKLRRFKKFILMFNTKKETWIKDEVIKMIDERLERGDNNASD